MKFSELKYKRPDLGHIQQKINWLLKEFDSSGNAEEQYQLIQKINTLRNHFETMMNIASVKYSLDTTDESYQLEQDFFDDSKPVYQGLVDQLYRSLLHSSFRADLEKMLGKQLFSIADLSVKTFSEEIVDDLKSENQLCSEYTKLLASAKVLFEGKERNLTEFDPFISSTSREIRKNAHHAKYTFFVENEMEFDRIFDELVKVRDGMAKKLGFKNFVELGYARMLRNEYNSEMVAGYRKQVKDFIVPIATDLKERQRKRLGLDDLYYYDEPLNFKSGNADPKGDSKWIVEKAQKMYEEFSPETKEFFSYMIDNELMDLTVRKGKASGGYCTVFNDYKSPFIFSNFTGTTHDIVVLTHEAGHAFQCYSSRDAEIPEYTFPTYEACEIHSMSMELLTWPWMDLFFEGCAQKFKFSHLNKSILFLPYGVAGDEFQHWVYEHPEASPEERKKIWRALEKKYLPHRNYSDNLFLENGGFWHQILHFYVSPFYFIDYTLAQTCAFQFWKKANEDRKKAMDDYLKLCKAGGTKSFLELVKLANLVSPFSGGCLESVAKDIHSWLNSVDDASL